MYSDRTLLKAVTNREDLLLTVSLFDDDTGEAIDLSGRTLAAPGDFTASAWTVTDGSIVTSSVTQITIPDYPIADTLQAVSLMVGTNLAIMPGDSITIADTATGLNTMTGYVTSYAAATGALVCQIGWVFAFEIRRPPQSWSGGYWSDWEDDWSTDFDNGGALITASLANGMITIIDVGVVQVLIPAATMRCLCRKAYKVGMGMTDSINTRQIMIAELPVLSGALTSIPPVLSINVPGANGLP